MYSYNRFCCVAFNEKQQFAVMKYLLKGITTVIKINIRCKGLKWFCVVDYDSWEAWNSFLNNTCSLFGGRHDCLLTEMLWVPCQLSISWEHAYQILLCQCTKNIMIFSYAAWSPRGHRVMDETHACWAGVGGSIPTTLDFPNVFANKGTRWNDWKWTMTPRKCFLWVPKVRISMDGGLRKKKVKKSCTVWFVERPKSSECMKTKHQ